MKKAQTKNEADMIPRDLKTVENMVDNIILDAKTWRTRMHKTLIAVSIFACSTGQIGPLQRLFAETKTMTHDNNVARWLMEFAPVSFTVTDGFKFSAKRAAEFAGPVTPKGDDRENIGSYIEMLLKAKNYWEMSKPANPFQGFDLRKKLAALLAQAEDYESGIYATGKELKGLPLSDEDREKVIVQKADINTLRSMLKSSNKDADVISIPAVTKKIATKKVADNAISVN